jgi:hypothetical protein
LRPRIFVPAALIAVAVLRMLAVSAFGAEPIHAKDGLALSGYDAVAYFTDAKG